MGWTINLTTGVPIKRPWRDTNKHTEKMAMCRQRQKLQWCCWSRAAPGIAGNHQGLRRGQEEFFPRNSWGMRALPTPPFWISRLPNCERIHFYCLKIKENRRQERFSPSTVVCQPLSGGSSSLECFNASHLTHLQFTFKCCHDGVLSVAQLVEQLFFFFF